MNDLSLYLSLWGKYVHMHVCTIFVYDKTNKYITIRKKKKKKLGTYIVETACILFVIIASINYNSMTRSTLNFSYVQCVHYTGGNNRTCHL